MDNQIFSKTIAALPIGKVVDFNPKSDTVYPMDFTAQNQALTQDCVNDTVLFSAYVSQLLSHNQARYGIGGYGEHRTIYNRSRHFDTVVGKPRRLHLGTDIWGAVGTSVYNFMDGKIYGFARNDAFGDYGATIIMRYQLEEQHFFALYGHLNAAALHEMKIGKEIRKGECFAAFGANEENGNWPPHLHFQLILDMQGHQTDYPGVCALDERAFYLANCPDPMLILNSTFDNA